MSGYEVRQQALAVRGLVEALREEGEDDDGIACAIQSESDLEEAVRAAVLDVVHTEALADAAKATAKTFTQRAQRLEARANGIRGAILAALEIVGLRKLVLPEATVSTGRGQATVVVTDEPSVPLDYRHAAPQVEAAFHALMRASALAEACGHADSGAQFQEAARGLLALFTLDRKRIAAALKEGVPVEGCCLGNSAPWLTLRRA